MILAGLSNGSLDAAKFKDVQLFEWFSTGHFKVPVAYTIVDVSGLIEPDAADVDAGSPMPAGIGLAMIVGLMLVIETTVHYTVNPGDDSHIKAFGVNFDAASPYIWAMAAILLIGGYLVARKTWTWVGHAWDDATSTARQQGIAA